MTQTSNGPGGGTGAEGDVTRSEGKGTRRGSNPTTEPLFTEERVATDPNGTARRYTPADLEEGRARRDRGATDAATATHVGWRRLAERALKDLAAEGRPFSADDLVARVGMPLGGNPNAIGGLFIGASRRGLITAVGFTQSKRADRNAGMQRLWVGAS